jgi:hypothetical protein
VTRRSRVKRTTAVFAAISNLYPNLHAPFRSVAG